MRGRFRSPDHDVARHALGSASILMPLHIIGMHGLTIRGTDTHALASTTGGQESLDFRLDDFGTELGGNKAPEAPRFNLHYS
jgi:hypothetical protein